MQRNNQNLPASRQQNLSPSGSNRMEGWFSSSPWQMMRRMQDDMDRLFEGFFTGSPEQSGMSPSFNAMWQPSMDLSQTDKEWRIDLDLPGVKPEDVQVETRDHYLTVRAEMREETGDGGPEEQRRYHHRERKYGYFERVLPLPDNVNDEQITCDFKDGVLSLRLPKTENAVGGPRRIPINQGQPQAQAQLKDAQGGGTNQQQAGKEYATAGANGSQSKK